MFTLIIRERNGDERREFFDEQEIVVGRIPGNDLVLRASNVSRQHARFVYRDERLIVSDLGSANGTYVNGRRIRHATLLRNQDEVWVGDFFLRVELPDGPKLESDGFPAPLSWYVYRVGGQRVGPVSTAQLAEGIRLGKVPLDSYVCSVGSDAWKPIDQVVDFIGAVRTIADSVSNMGALATEMPPHVATDSDSEVLWYVSAQGGVNPIGPMTTEQLRTGIRSGQIGVGGKVNRAGTPDWFDMAATVEFYDEVLRFSR